MYLNICAIGHGHKCIIIYLFVIPVVEADEEVVENWCKTNHCDNISQ